MGNRGPISVERKMKTSQVLEGTPEPVAAEGLSKEAEAEWRRITGLLRKRRVLDALDQAALRDYVVCWQRLRECEDMVARDGVLIEGARGLVKNPACQLARNYRDALLAWSKEFGLTVSSRQRLALPEERRPNKFDGLLHNRLNTA